MMQRFQRFMMGRYGGDMLNMVMIGVSMLLAIMSRWTWPGLGIIGLLILVLAVFRMMSKNTIKRRRENAVFLKLFAPFKRMVGEFKQRKSYRFFSCPKCKQRVRVPRGKGRISITCPKCKEKFTKTV